MIARRIAVLLFLAAGTAGAQTSQGIAHIKEFLRTCPDRDPAIARIRADFEIRNQGNPVTSVRCTEPYNQMPADQLTTELAFLQVLRVMYYMDPGRSNHLPWTPLRLYDWVKSKVDGINFRAGGTFGCCETVSGKRFILGTLLNQTSLALYRDFRGIAAGIAVVAHEARHVDGFGHTGCCPVGANACDQAYDERNLSPYGIQSWLYRNWLSGNINVGLFCSYADEINAASFELSVSETGYYNRFCDAKPPLRQLTMPLSETPGGACSLRTLRLPDRAVTNAAGYSTASMVPGEMTVIFAPGIGPTASATGPVLTAQGAVDTTLVNTRVLFNGKPGPMIYATRDQLSAIAPWDMGFWPGRTGLESYVEVERSGQLSNILLYRYASVGLQIFTADQSGGGQAAALNQDGSFNSRDSAAPPDSYVTIFGTGGGATAPPQRDGQVTALASPFPALPGQTRVVVAGIDAEVSYAGAAPGLVAGVVQINFRVPPGTAPGVAVPVQVVYGLNANPVTIAVR